MRLKIASRKSDLARIQSYSVGHALQQANPGLEIEYIFRESLGDINQNDPLWKMPERGVFTEDFYAGLLSSDWDAVVHSWKDLPVAEREGSFIAATLPRADSRDLLVMPKVVRGQIESTNRMRILSSSPRRQYNLEPLLPELLPFSKTRFEFLPVRGNVPTRLRKLFAGEGDALIVAKAALDRLLKPEAFMGEKEAQEFLATKAELRKLLDDAMWMVLPLSQNPTAAAQGALAVEIARNRPEVEKILATIHSPETSADAHAERQILARYGGGCHQKIGVSVVRGEFGRALSLRGLTDAGETLSAFELVESEIPPACPVGQEFPRNAERPDFFERRSLSAPANPGSPILVAKADALPEEWQIAADQIVWVAGHTTWKKLAARGIWVNGSCDSLGESIPELEALVGKKITFTKLTHSGAEAEGKIPTLSTYELVDKEEIPDLSTRTHFYWASGSQFDAAIRRFPKIVEGVHACGFGNTYRHIQKRLGKGGKIYPRISQAAWLEEIRQ